jgi:hypothetical protein
LRAKPISCDDANAWPGVKEEVPFVDSDCHGNFIRHHWGSKEKTKGDLQTAVMQLMTQLLQKQVKQSMDSVVVQEMKTSTAAAGE